MLYVEDEEGDRLLMEYAFQKTGLNHGLRMAHHGKAAIDYLSGIGRYSDRVGFPLPAVVLLDLNLPEVHGFGVLKWIRMRALYNALPVVVFSSSGRDEDRRQAELLGANDFVQKPLTQEGCCLDVFSGISSKGHAAYLPRSRAWPGGSSWSDIRELCVL